MIGGGPRQRRAVAAGGGTGHPRHSGYGGSLTGRGGVKQASYLEERGIGFDGRVTKVPLVCQSDLLFDSTWRIGRPRPDAALRVSRPGVNAEAGNYRMAAMAGIAQAAATGPLHGSPASAAVPQVGRRGRCGCGGSQCAGRYYDYETGRKAVVCYTTADLPRLVGVIEAENKFVGNDRCCSLRICLTNLGRAAGIA